MMLKLHGRRPAQVIGCMMVAAMLPLAACTPAPVDWTERRSMPAAAQPVQLRADGSMAVDSMALLAARVALPPGGVCPGSLRLARAGGTLFGVWWTVRPDSSAALRSSRSTDEGVSWSTPAAVDTLDRSVSGCHREPPAIAADSASGYVHVTYGLLAPEGPGLFFAHSMDRGVTFHAPVPILYGERLGRTSVAADGDAVVVGFEDPSSGTPRIGLALSHSMGHIFEERLVPLSDDNGAAYHPYTAVQGHRIAVAWERRADPTAPPVVLVRVGRLH